MRNLLPLASAALLVTALTGCGGNGADKGATTSRPTPEQLENAASLAMVRAHQRASLRLYEAGQAGQAAKHAGHPIEEIFWSISRTLRSEDAALTADLRKALKQPANLIYAKAPPRQLKLAYDKAWSLLDRAEASLVPEQVQGSSAFRAQLIARLLEKVEGEYGEAIEDSQIVKRIEYQDAWGALTEAGRHFKADRADFGGEAASVEQRLATLREALPSVSAPRKPVPLEGIERAVDAATDELAKVAGTEVASDPLAEVKKARALLARAKSEYAQGKSKVAEQTVAEAYLEHFEKVEPPLGKRDKELMEDLEVLIATDLRRKIKAGAPKGEIEALMVKALKGLRRADKVLGASGAGGKNY